MAIIPSTYSVVFWDPSDRLYITANQANVNKTDTAYTMQDIIDTVGGGGGVISIASGGTGQTTAQAAIDALTQAGAASGGDLLQNNGGSVVFVPGIQVTGYQMVQVFQWVDGTPVAYTNWTSGVASNLPFNPIEVTKGSTNAPGPTAYTDFGWTCVNAVGGTAGEVATFTLGADGSGTWKISTTQHWFDQTNQVEVRVSLNVNGTIIDVIDNKSTELTGDKIFNGYLVQSLVAGDTIQVEVEFAGGGISPFPSDTGNRPTEITFERVSQ